MQAAPFLVYLAAIAIVWLLIGGVLPPVLRRVRRLGVVLARRITARPKIGRVLSLLPERILALQPYAALIVIAGLGLAVAFAAGDEFFDLAEKLREQSPTMLRIDEAVHEWARSSRSESLTPFFLTFTEMGNPAALAILLSTGVALSLVRRRWRLATYLVVTAALGALLNRALKLFFARQRPDLFVALADAAHESFPSGHAMGSVIVLGALAYASVLLGRTWRIRSFCVSVSIVSALTIAISRIYLGVHWISDIAAGLAAGIAWVMTSVVVYETVRQIRNQAGARRKSSPVDHASAARS